MTSHVSSVKLSEIMANVNVKEVARVMLDHRRLEGDYMLFVEGDVVQVHYKNGLVEYYLVFRDTFRKEGGDD